MATAEQKDMMDRVNEVIEQSWNHLTPGTPDYEVVAIFKRRIREAIAPTPAQPEATTTKPTKTTATNT